MFFALSVAGCGTDLPALTSKEVLPVDQLVMKIRCEFATAISYEISQGYGFLKDWQASYIITMKANESGTLAADANKFPFALGSSSVAVGAGGSAKGSTNRTALLKYDLDVSDIDTFQLKCKRTTSGHPLLRGELGFAEWLDTALKASISNDDQKPQERLTSIGHTFEFALATSAGVSPVFTIVPKPIVLNPSIAVSRLEDNIVDVVLAKRKGAGAPIYARTVSAKQLEKITKLQAEKDAAQQAVSRASIELADAKKFNAQIRELSAKLVLKGIKVDPQTKKPDPNTNLSPDQEKDVANLQTFSEKSFNLGDETAIEQRRNRAAGEASSSEREIRAIRARPDGPTTVVRRNIGTGTAADNQIISSTQLQLTLERVLGNSRF